MTKVVLGLSGGVDSAVAARLLQQNGYEIRGLYLDIGTPDARADAEAAAEFLGIPLTVRDASRELEQYVCAPFTESYLRGETPNPCILCNPAVKFAALLEEAEHVGADYIATGHYARTEHGALYRGKPANDQSYMLCRLTREQCERALSGALTQDDLNSDLLRKFFVQAGQNHLHPKVIVAYERTPFVYAPGNVRITFDRNIGSSSDISSFFSSYLPLRPVMPAGSHVLEVKYDEFLPDYLYRAMDLGSLRQTAFSKYYLCRKFCV